MRDERATPSDHSAGLSASYDAVYEGRPVELRELEIAWPRNRWEALIKWAGSGDRLLEIGFGSAEALFNCRARFKELWGVELSRSRVETANKALRKAAATSVHLSVGNIEAGLDFPAGYFDCIVWADVLEHVVDVWAAMDEVSRLLSSGGRLLTTTPNVAELRRRFQLLGGRFPATAGSDQGLQVRDEELFDGGHLHYFTYSSLERLYARHGITPSARYGFGRLGRLHNLWPSLLSSAVCVKGVRQ